MKLRCYLLSFLKIHKPDCDYCTARETCGLEMRRRLEELNGRTPPSLVRKDSRGEVATVLVAKRREDIGSPPASSAHEVRKAS